MSKNLSSSETILPFFRKFRYKTIAAVLLIFFIFSLLFSFFYLRKINTYKPVTIRIIGPTWNELKAINVYSITPWNRKLNMPYKDEIQGWSIYYGFVTSIEFEIPDSLSTKVTRVEIEIDRSVFKTKLKELQASNQEKGKYIYKVPSQIYGGKSFFEMIFSLHLWPQVQLFFKFFCVAIILLLFFFRKKIKRLITPMFSFLKIEKNISRLIQWLTSRKILFIWIKIILVSVLIACTFFYGYLYFKFSVTTFITGMLFILIAGLVLWVFVLIISKIFKISDARYKKIKINLRIFLLTWICFEIILRSAGFNKSYNEKIGFFYASGFNDYEKVSKQSCELMVHPPYYSYNDKRKEFNYEIKCNSEGLRDVEHAYKKDSNEYRIICIGNSFTEGIGAPQDSTWPCMLKSRLKLSQKKIVVFNAGISSSDPFFEYRLLEKKMIKYKPDLIIEALGSSDFSFYRFRGGFERFKEDGYHYRKAPGWEKFYGLSYIFRFFINDILGYEDYLSPSEFKADNLKAKQAIENCIYRFQQLSLKQHFKLAIMFIDDGDNKYDSVISKLKKDKFLTIFDLFEYNNAIEKMTPVMRNNCYWPIDGHCRPKGYALMAKGVEWYLKKYGMIDSLITKESH